MYSIDLFFICFLLYTLEHLKEEFVACGVGLPAVHGMVTLNGLQLNTGVCEKKYYSINCYFKIIFLKKV